MESARGPPKRKRLEKIVDYLGKKFFDANVKFRTGFKVPGTRVFYLVPPTLSAVGLHYLDIGAEDFARRWFYAAGIMGLTVLLHQYVVGSFYHKYRIDNIVDRFNNIKL